MNNTPKSSQLPAGVPPFLTEVQRSALWAKHDARMAETYARNAKAWEARVAAARVQVDCAARGVRVPGSKVHGRVAAAARDFAEKYVVTPAGCWSWLGELGADGTPIAWNHPKGFWLPLRYAWRLYRSNPDFDLLQLEPCPKDAACVNPAHLQLRLVDDLRDPRRPELARRRPPRALMALPRRLEELEDLPPPPATSPPSSPCQPVLSIVGGGDR